MPFSYNGEVLLFCTMETRLWGTQMQITKTALVRFTGVFIDRRNRKNLKGCKPGKAQTRRQSNMGKQGHRAQAKEKPKTKRHGRSRTRKSKI